jgi:hypothetical protein
MFRRFGAIDPALPSAEAPVHLDRGVKLFVRVGVFASRVKGDSPVMQGVGLIPWQRVSLEVRDRLFEMRR